MSDGARIVLVKPGDVLILGNVHVTDDEAMEALCGAVGELKRLLDLKQVLVFADDIDLATQSQARYATGGVILHSASADRSPENVGPCWDD